MLLQRTTLSESMTVTANKDGESRFLRDGERPLTCMFYFFASQMKRNIQPPDPDLVQRRMADGPTHRMDTLLARIGLYAAHSPLITSFETYPVDIPDAPGFSAKNPKPPREVVHDTMLLMKFRDKRAREEWIATKEWQEFMQKTEAEKVFRRMPHVRCASSVRGLMDPIDILTA